MVDTHQSRQIFTHFNDIEIKVLFLGEYSNVRWALIEGLRQLRHTVTMVSNDDSWENYQRDINLSRALGELDGICYMARLYRLLPLLCGYDAVQVANPIFLEIEAYRVMPIYKYSRRHSKKTLTGVFGMDYCWVHTCCTDMSLKYSDFSIGKELRQTVDALKE